MACLYLHATSLRELSVAMIPLDQANMMPVRTEKKGELEGQYIFVSHTKALSIFSSELGQRCSSVKAIAATTAR